MPFWQTLLPLVIQGPSDKLLLRPFRLGSPLLLLVFFPQLVHLYSRITDTTHEFGTYGGCKMHQVNNNKRWFIDSSPLLGSWQRTVSVVFVCGDFDGSTVLRRLCGSTNQCLLNGGLHKQPQPLGFRLGIIFSSSQCIFAHLHQLSSNVYNSSFAEEQLE